ncbi:MAG: sugar kinase [Proteobacteria bacterium]|nr:sugar kinase [Pseudomonadota bacterium]
MSARFDVVALGEAMIEFNRARGGAANTWLQGFGGDTSNAVIAAARLGARCAYVTRVGDDAFGRELLSLWSAEGVDTAAVAVDAAAPTGVYFVTHDDGSHHFAYLRSGSAASRSTSAGLPGQCLASTRLLHLSAISQAISPSACDASFAAIDIARGAGARVAYDTNLRLALWPLARARAIVVETLRRCEFALPGADDARHLFGTGDPRRVADECHALGVAVVVVKLGRDGCYVSGSGVGEHIDAISVDAVDATGAGDCFDGAFLARIAAGDAPVDAARYANAAAALATTGYGAVAPLPRADAVANLLRRHGLAVPKTRSQKRVVTPKLHDRRA